MARKTTPWKKKQTFTILAPKGFEHRSIGSCVALDPKNLLGRTIGVSIWEMLGDKTKQHMKIVFEIDDVKGDKAYTRFKKFEVNPGYLRSKIKKGSSKIDSIVPVELKDKEKIQVKVITTTYHHISTTKEKDMRARIFEIGKSYSKTEVDDFIQQVISGKVGSNMYKNIKKISPTRRVEIEEVKVV